MDLLDCTVTSNKKSFSLKQSYVIKLNKMVHKNFLYFTIFFPKVTKFLFTSIKFIHECISKRNSIRKRGKIFKK